MQVVQLAAGEGARPSGGGPGLSPACLGSSPGSLFLVSCVTWSMLFSVSELSFIICTVGVDNSASIS